MQEINLIFNMRFIKIGNEIMKLNRTKNAKRNIVWGIVNKIIVIIFPFIIRTLLLKVLGEQYLGLNGLFTSILQVLSLSELGFSMAMVYSMYKPIAQEDTERICALLNLYKKVYRYMGLFILLIGICLIPFLNNLIKGDHPNDINLYVLYLIYLGNTVISYWLFAYKSSLLIAHQRTDIDINILSITNVLMYVFQIAIICILKNYYLFIICIPIFTIIKNIIVSIVVNRVYPQYICKGELDKEFIKDLKIQLKALVGHKIGAIVLSAADNIVISAFIGLSTVAIYNNYLTLINAVGSILNIIYSSVTAGIGNSIAKESVDKNYSDFNMLTFMNMWLVGWFSICFLCLFQPFIIIWLGEKYIFKNITMILFVIYFVIMYMRKVVNMYKDASGMWQADVAKPYIEAITNLIINLVLVNIIGINGVLISSILAMGIISLPWEAHVLYKNYFKKNELKYYFDLIKYCILILLNSLFTYFLCSLLPLYGIHVFALKLIICLIVPNIIFFIFYFKNIYFRNCLKYILPYVANPSY